MSAIRILDSTRYAFVRFSSMTLSANRDHDLPDMLVALNMAMRLDNIFKRKCLVDYGFQTTVGDSAVPVQMNVAAVTSTTSTQLTRLKAIDCAFSRKVHHA